ncbi:MAG: ABC transporter permease [Bacteroidaceae bacterium]|nr:ABC transporter permease [Bacteroidaceae bacterium]
MRDIFNIYIGELRRCISDIGVAVFFILVPLGYPLLYTYIYSREVVREIDVVVCDLSNSYSSRSFVRKLDATPEVRTAMKATNMLAAREALEENRVKGIVFIPEEFNDNITKGEQAHISIYCSMASLFYYKSILVACTDVSLAMNRDIQIEEIAGLTREEKKIATLPLQYESIGLSNNNTGFANFVIPAIVVLILQQTLLLGIGMRVGSDRERRVETEGHTTLHIIANIIARAMAYLTIYTPVTAYILCIVPALFGLSQLSNGVTLLFFMLPYLLACIFFAMTISLLFIHQRETPMLLFVFTSIPFLFLSGISWPASNIPAYWKGVSYLLPSTFGINGFVSINQMRATIADVQFEYRALWILCCIYFVTAVVTLRKKVRHLS